MRTIPFTEEIAIKNAKRAYFINMEIEELFDITLVTCPHCSAILSFPPKHEGDYTCKHCGTTDEQCYFPDLFY